MAYNKAKAEKEWVEWKNNEEKQLRELGVDEDTIQRLHSYDWKAFKAERNYRYWNLGSMCGTQQMTFKAHCGGRRTCLRRLGVMAF